MAGDLNKVMLIGRMTADPELTYTQGNTALCKFSMANNRVYMTGNGEKKEEVSYFNCTAWGKLGETITEYVKKGHRIAIEGRLQQSRWEDKEGGKRSKVEIVIEKLQFLEGKKQSGSAGAEDESKNYADESSGSASDDDKYRPSSGPENNPFADDDIPF